MIELQQTVTPAQVAKRFGTKAETVIRWIRTGELKAVDVSSQSSTRPRFRIDPDDLAAFESRRSVQTKPKIQRRRRRKDPAVTQYF